MITSTTPIPSGPSVVGVSANVSDALSGLGTNKPQLQWCISHDASRNWSAPIPMTGASGSQWTTPVSQNGAQASGDTFYYQVTAQDVAGNTATVGASAPMTFSGGGLGGAVPMWAEFSVAILFIFLIIRFMPKKRVSPSV
jgi:hypothetical protein